MDKKNYRKKSKIADLLKKEIKYFRTHNYSLEEAYDELADRNMDFVYAIYILEIVYSKQAVGNLIKEIRRDRKISQLPKTKFPFSPF